MSLKIYDERTLLIVNEKGRLQILLVPFMVRAMQDAGIIKAGMLVQVRAVTGDVEFILLYKILDQWLSHSCFILIH